MRDRLKRHFGRAWFDSYQNRYLALAVSVSVVLRGAGVFGYRQVATVSTEQFELIQARSQAIAKVQDAFEQMNVMQNALHRFLINPPLIEARQLYAAVDQLHIHIALLAQLRSVRSHADMRGYARQAFSAAERLTPQVSQLVALRENPTGWFPTLGVMETDMLPKNQAVLAMLADMVSVEKDQLHDKSRQNPAAFVTMVDLQSEWLHATSELRLLVANRFGIFSSQPAAAISSRAENIDAYLELLNKNIRRLQVLSSTDQLNLVAEDHLPNLKSQIAAWTRDYRKAVADMTSPNWRADLNYTRDTVSPALAVLRDSLSRIRQELDRQSAHNITTLTGMSKRLATATVLVAIAGSVVLMLTYWMFSRLILRPIEDTTLALKHEAHGRAPATPPPVEVRETRNLIEAFKEMQQQVRIRQSHLDHLAHHDPLTHLPNRLLLMDRLEHALVLAGRDQSKVGVLFLDLDRFKQINDSLGHAAGDKLLQMVTTRLLSVTRRSDTVARLGGDEFAIIAERIDRAEELAALAEKLIHSLDQPFDLADRQLHVSVSIGIAIYPDNNTDAEGLIRGADTAMYDAKRAGAGCFRFFTADMAQRATDDLELETCLRTAIRDQRFELHYQPILCRDGRTAHGCEALLRLHDTVLGQIPPSRFVPVLEAMGQLGVVSEWILDQIALHQRDRLSRDGIPLTASVNLTAKLLHDEQFSQRLLSRLAARSPAPEHLIVEVTEDSLTQDIDRAQRMLHQLRELGVSTALDDFGTGQSSLSQLRFFAFDLVKIDREFVNGILDDPHDRNLVSAIIQLSQLFGMSVVAEGVETAEQAELLRKLQCDYFQGYLYSRPLPPEELAWETTQPASAHTP